MLSIFCSCVSASLTSRDKKIAFEYSAIKCEKREANEGSATILGIGTANPPNCLYQTEYPDFYFRLTNTDHMTELKAKFKRICEKSRIKKRYFHLSEEILRANPNMCEYKAPSFDTRQEMMKEQVPKLGKEAALKAIQEWDQPISSITHLIFCTSSSIQMPGPDYQLTKLLGLSPSIKRFMLFQHGCYATGSALRLAKDVAENNVNARILLISVDITAMSFHAPSETHLDILVDQAIFSDGAAAVIIGADPDPATEQPLFQIMSASQTIIPNSEEGVVGHVSEMGLSYFVSPKTPKLIGQYIKQSLADAIPVGISDYNSFFYVIHPGGPAILDQIEQKLGLKEEKLEASREVLSEYGNMAGPTVVFVLDEMRKKSMKEGKKSTGEGLEWGLLVCIGPGLTVETVMLRSVPI